VQGAAFPATDVGNVREIAFSADRHISSPIGSRQARIVRTQSGRLEFVRPKAGVLLIKPLR